MIKIRLLGAFAVLAALALTGCKAPKAPESAENGMGPLQIRTLSVRNIGEEFGATYDDVWYSTISTLQLNGFILKQADKQSGFIYGVWRDTYERQDEYTKGGFIASTLSSNPSYVAGIFASRTATFKQIDVSVTMERLAKNQTLVRFYARFDNNGVPAVEGVFANRFFGMLRKEVFLRVNHGSLYHTFSQK